MLPDAFMNTAPNSTGTVAERILGQLHLWGVKRIYGVVGDAIFGLMDAIAKQNKIQFIAVKHESTAAMMASAEAKITGGLGVCTATMGPGLGNLLNGLGDAYKDKAPVLAITGQAPTDKIGTDYKQYVNQQELIKPFARYSTLLAHPNAVIEVLTKAMHMSLVKGAVTHLSVPKDMFTMTTTAMPRSKPLLLKGTYYFEAEGLQQAIDIMNTAQRPMILAGIGARDAAQHVEALAEKWGAGLLVSLGAKGFLPGTSSNLLGGIGQGGNPYAAQVFKQADVVLLVGDTWWPDGYVPENARIIQIDYMQENIGKGIPIELGIVGDSAAIVPLLIEGLQQSGTDPAWGAQWREAKEKWTQQNEQEGSQTSSPIHPARIVRAIENSVQPNAILTLDTGDVTVWMNRNFRPKQQDFLFSGEWRTMGFGLPAALAAKLCMPERQIVAIVGDGGIEMVLADLLTAARYELQITVIVFNNGYLQMERDKMIVSGFKQEGVDITNPDFVKVAEACGWNGYRVDSDAQLEQILQQALSSRRPALVEVLTAPVVHPETKG
ncbi:thiamine pyrophosphate-binding protein [Aneurinibacillus sp. UBA3580]|jgi:pyruvate dehydrogenase (quinone)/pyruvate oxidase|uniref:thiamine pyrophosphate-binding protein n=1 Tax=Aneurinibacillus sp. UBA3580 TaxID=1946041 RepID=UPI00257C81B0|nr:thiamine pyrophosphate-binding protein [Aneurinibacillus sp. UBA3580]